MTAPSWPRLAGWMHTAEPPAARGSWRTVEDGREDTGTFAFRPPEDRMVLDDGGRLAEHSRVHGLWAAHEWERSDDYHRAAGPVVAVEQAGRACWQVQLEPPARKRGLLTVVVDEQTGLCLRMANDAHAAAWELVEVELVDELPDELFAPLLASRAEGARIRARHDLCLSRPPPTPRWFPWRRTWTWGHGLVEVRTWHGEGSVGRAPLGEPAPVSEWLRSEHVVRLDHGGWSWAVATGSPIDEATARRVVEQVVEPG